MRRLRCDEEIVWSSPNPQVKTERGIHTRNSVSNRSSRRASLGELVLKEAIYKHAIISPMFQKLPHTNRTPNTMYWWKGSRFLSERSGRGRCGFHNIETVLVVCACGFRRQNCQQRLEAFRKGHVPLRDRGSCGRSRRRVFERRQLEKYSLSWLIVV